ncbi:MAG: GNAT family N-acetyltransferase [Planctomycetia bacterium]
MSELVVRPAVAADAAVIVAYNAALALESEAKHLHEPTLAAGVAAVLNDPSLGRYFVADRDGAVVGQLMLTHEWSDWRNGMIWWIQSVYVAPTDRGKGVYNRLHDHVRRLADATPSVIGLRLYVELRNTKAQRTYFRQGMTQSGYVVLEDMREGAGD